MKVLVNTPDELILESRPWGPGIVVILLALGVVWGGMAIIAAGDMLPGLAVLGVGGGLCLTAFWALVRLEEVRFSRPDGVVHFRVRSIGGRSEDEIALASVRSAIIETKVSTRKSGSRNRRRSNGGMSRTHRPALLMSDTGAPKRPLTLVYTGNERHQQDIVNTVNGWLAQRPT